MLTVTVGARPTIRMNESTYISHWLPCLLCENHFLIEVLVEPFNSRKFIWPLISLIFEPNRVKWRKTIHFCCWFWKQCCRCIICYRWPFRFYETQPDFVGLFHFHILRSHFKWTSFVYACSENMTIVVIWIEIVYKIYNVLMCRMGIWHFPFSSITVPFNVFPVHI